MVKQYLTAILAAGVALAGANAIAAETGEWYIAPSALFMDDDEDRGVEDGFVGAQLTLGYAFSDHWSWEVFGNIAGADADAVPGQDQDLIELGSNLVFIADRDARFTPFFLAGVSHLDTNFDNATAGASEPGRDRFAFSGGLGFMLAFGDSPLSLRTEYRLRKETSGGDRSFSDSLTDQLVLVGLEIGLGERGPRLVDTDGDGVDDSIDRCPNTPLGATVDATGCEIDSDGDGVVDSKDECPDTPRGTPVDERGCPAADSDGDGVIDERDQCPNTPAGARVDANGCELDDDGDGVVNSRDRCPNTRAGARVDVNGCEIREVIRLPGVTFETNSDRLLPGAEQVLDDF
ncbi:MAG: thrombospondin type 3 repeat-containing protein, partial [Pseudomonadota bacterium]